MPATEKQINDFIDLTGCAALVVINPPADGKPEYRWSIGRAQGAISKTSLLGAIRSAAEGYETHLINLPLPGDDS